MTDQPNRPTPEQIEHKAFLAKITADARGRIVQLVQPRFLGIITDELDALVDAAKEEIRFLHRVGALTDED